MMLSLLLIGVESIVTDHCRTFLFVLQKNGWLNYIGLDEAHLIITADHYRELLGRLGYLQTLRYLFICLIATFSPYAEPDLWKALHFSQLRIICGQSGQHYLRYLIQLVQLLPERKSREEAFHHQAIAICNTCRSQWPFTKLLVRNLCFIRLKNTGSHLAEELGSNFYHAELELMVKKELIENWANVNKSDILVITVAFSTGLDYASVYLILYINSPFDLLDYVQKTGQSGRDGQLSKCIVLFAPKQKILQKSNYCNNFLLLDCQYMKDYLQVSQCLQVFLFTYLNIKSFLSFDVVCTTFYKTEVCSICATVHIKSDLSDNLLSTSIFLLLILDFHVSGNLTLTPTSQLQSAFCQVKNISLTSSSQSLIAVSQPPPTNYKPRKKNEKIFDFGSFSSLPSIPPLTFLFLGAFPLFLVASPPLLVALVPQLQSIAPINSSSLRLQLSTDSAIILRAGMPLVCLQIRNTAVPDFCSSSSQFPILISSLFSYIA